MTFPRIHANLISLYFELANSVNEDVKVKLQYKKDEYGYAFYYLYINENFVNLYNVREKNKLEGTLQGIYEALACIRGLPTEKWLERMELKNLKWLISLDINIFTLVLNVTVFIVG